MDEYFFNCPFCFSEVSILIDLSQEKQEYVEDCERCCNPIQFSIETDKQEIINVKLEDVN